jgi:hypothetical protein
MRNKSIINVKTQLVDELAAGRHSYGAILAECYWKETKDGFLIQSQPTISEILDGWFYPFKISITDNRIYINKWFTHLKIESFNESGGVHVERIVLKPDLEAPEAPPGFVKQQATDNFREHWTAND